MRRLTAALVLCGVIFWAGFASAQPHPIGTTKHGAVSVLTTSTSVLARSAQVRLLLVLVNDGANTIYCNLGGAVAVLNEGIRLNSSGGSLLLDVAVMAAEIFCIAETGTTTLLVTECT